MLLNINFKKVDLMKKSILKTDSEIIVTYCIDFLLWNIKFKKIKRC